jgi:hypothetical protein
MSQEREARPIVYLKPDSEIRGQNYGLISFLTPPVELTEKKEAFLFANYINSKKKAYNNVLPEEIELSKKTKEELLQEKAAIVAKIFDSETSLIEDYKGYKNIHGSELEEQFSKMVKGMNTVHGVKMRGNFNSLEEAKAAAIDLQKMDPIHNIYVGQIGYWLPWNPNSDEIEDQKYMNEQLDDIMKGYRENQQKSKEFFQDRKNEMLEDMEKENQSKIEKNKQLLEANQEEGQGSEPVELSSESSEPSNVTSQMNAMVDSEPFLGSASLTKD